MKMDRALNALRSMPAELRAPALFDQVADLVTEASRRANKASRSAGNFDVWRGSHSGKAIEALNDATDLLRRVGHSERSGFSNPTQVDALKAVGILDAASTPWLQQLGPAGTHTKSTLNTVSEEIKTMATSIRALGVESQIRAETERIAVLTGTVAADVPVLKWNAADGVVRTAAAPANAELVGNLRQAIASYPKALKGG